LSTHPATNLSSTSSVRLCPGLVEIEGAVYVGLVELLQLLQEEAGIDEPGFWRRLWRRAPRKAAA
jgi:hypothetical protein